MMWTDMAKWVCRAANEWGHAVLVSSLGSLSFCLSDSACPVETKHSHLETMHRPRTRCSAIHPTLPVAREACLLSSDLHLVFFFFF